MTLADPKELSIVCSEFSLQIQPEDSSKEKETVLSIDRIALHPLYDPGTNKDTGADLKGPYAGHDIAVYHLTEKSRLNITSRMRLGELWPACLPKKQYTSGRGIFAGWLDQEPFYRQNVNKIDSYERQYIRLKATMVGKTHFF